MKHLGSLESTQEARVALGYASSVTTVQGATFNMRGQLYCGHANAMVFSSSPVVSVLGSESDDLGSSPGWGQIYLNLYIIY